MRTLWSVWRCTLDAAGDALLQVKGFKLSYRVSGSRPVIDRSVVMLVTCSYVLTVLLYLVI